MKSALRAREYRYVHAVVEGPAEEMPEGAIRASLGSSLTSFFGSYGLADVKPKFIRYEAASQSSAAGARAAATGARVIIRCARGEEMKLCAALSLISKLENKRAHVRPIRVSGTIAGLERKMEKDGENF